jgi:hypothetical protein
MVAMPREMAADEELVTPRVGCFRRIRMTELTISAQRRAAAIFIGAAEQGLREIKQGVSTSSA